MARKLSNETKLKRKVGTGEGKKYKPYITTSEFNSTGTTTVIKDWKTGRGIHCLSQGEVYWYYILRWVIIILILESNTIRTWRDSHYSKQVRR